MLPFCLQLVHVLWVPLCPDRYVFEILCWSRGVPRRVLGDCWQHFQVSASAHVLRGAYFLQTYFLQYNNWGPFFVPGAQPTFRIHQRFCRRSSNTSNLRRFMFLSCPLITRSQVTGRNIWIFALIDSEPRMQTKPVVFYLFMTYSVIEIFRLLQLIFLLKNRWLSNSAFVQVSLLLAQHQWPFLRPSNLVQVI